MSDDFEADMAREALNAEVIAAGTGAVMVTNERDAKCNRAWERFAILLIQACLNEKTTNAISDAALDYAAARIAAVQPGIAERSSDPTRGRRDE